LSKAALVHGRRAEESHSRHPYCVASAHRHHGSTIERSAVGDDGLDAIEHHDQAVPNKAPRGSIAEVCPGESVDIGVLDRARNFDQGVVTRDFLAGFISRSGDGTYCKGCAPCDLDIEGYKSVEAVMVHG
jgi:hypothetical protein